MRRLAIGILAHVDSGKTTLSEALLYQAGQLRKLGRVDHGDAFLDSHLIEKERGITIFSKQALLCLPQTEITLLDTPGHVDFGAETERTLQVLDYAILVISGTDGVQSHTETLWNLLRRYRVPTFLFINKMDLPGADRTALMEELKTRLSPACVDFSAEPAAAEEALALCDETLLAEYLEHGAVSAERRVTAIARRRVFPCYFGSALRLDGIGALITGLETQTRPPEYWEHFAAKVYKITEDEQGGRLTHLKITGGALEVKDTVEGQTAAGAAWTEKVNQIRLYSGTKYQTVLRAEPGMVCAVTGLTQTAPGQGLGAEEDSALPVLEPVLTYQVQLPPGIDAHTALLSLRRLEEEEPELHVIWNEQLGEIHLQLMGQVQLEILQQLIADRFGMEITFGRGSIVYKETIAAPVEGVGHFEPLRHYAEVHLLLEPLPRGSGLVFATACREEDLDKSWQHLVLTHLEEKTHRGVLTGSPITDLKITLLTGRAHVKHTEGGDFRQATYRAVRQGLRRAESILLEPWYSFRLELPAETVGRAMSDLQRMGAIFDPPQITGDSAALEGSAPVACLADYPREITGYTRGKGRLFCRLKGYEPCHNPQEVIESIGYRCDGDLENTADSVFCAHGAGFVVGWADVPQYMHLAAYSPAAPKHEEPTTLPPRRSAAAYYATLEEDKALMAIFERTYGPIRRDKRKAFAPPPKTAPVPSGGRAMAPLPTGPEYLLVDGYNIIFAWDSLSALAQESMDAAREKLITILCNYQGYCLCEVILVFDAYKIKGNPGTVEKIHNISVVYTKEAETADMYIEKATHRIGRSRRVRVATSDGVEQLIILGNGALRISARAFEQEVEAAQAEIRKLLE